MISPQGCDLQTGGIAYDNIKHIVIITDSVYTAKRIFKLSLHLYQIFSAAISQELREFFRKYNNIITLNSGIVLVIKIGCYTL